MSRTVNFDDYYEDFSVGVFDELPRLPIGEMFLLSKRVPGSLEQIEYLRLRVQELDRLLGAAADEWKSPGHNLRMAKMRGVALAVESELTCMRRRVDLGLYDRVSRKVANPDGELWPGEEDGNE